MISFIWILTWFSLVLPVVSDLPQPVNVTLRSDHFIHLLEWEPGPGTPAGAYYSVSVISETGTSRDLVNGCEHVQHVLACNLTEAFPEKMEIYFTSVTVHLAGKASVPATYPRFRPIRDTVLDLPEVTVTSCSRDLCVDLQPRMHQLKDAYNLLHYKLRIESISNNNVQSFKEFKSLRSEILKDLAGGREYCISICFSDSIVPRYSVYGPARCAFTSVIHSADPFIATALSLLVTCAVILTVLLIVAGFICLKRIPLPSILTSIHHIEELLVIVPSNNTAFSSLMHVEDKPLPPSQKRSSQISDDEDGESIMKESKDERTGDNYKLGGSANRSCYLSSSSSLVLPLSSEPDLLPSLNAEPSFALSSSDLLNPNPDVLSSTVGNLSPPADTYSLTPEKKEVAADNGGHDVNLLTLTFGRYVKEDEEKEKSNLDKSEVETCSSEEHNIPSVLLSRTVDSKEVCLDLFCSSAEEEEEDDDEALFSYMRRP